VRQSGVYELDRRLSGEEGSSGNGFRHEQVTLSSFKELVFGMEDSEQYFHSIGPLYMPALEILRFDPACSAYAEIAPWRRVTIPPTA
jgi:hypothetical protein